MKKKTKKSLDFAIEYTLREKENLQNRIISELDKISKTKRFLFKKLLTVAEK